MAFVESLSPFFTDFAVNVTRNGSASVVGLFDKPYGEAFGMIGGNDPVFRCMSSIGMARGDTLAISGTTYTVTHIEPDGTGIDLCRLEAA
jgi:hypothetical protein